MLTFRNLSSAFHNLDLGDKPVIAHASLSAFGEIQGGAVTMLGALRSVIDSLLMPAFTYKTMIVPENGPLNNGITYGSAKHANRMAEFFDPKMPADKSVGVIAETLRQLPDARRSIHPILSFTGVSANEAIFAQTLQEPFASIKVLADADGWVLLLGVDHTANTSIHYGEQLAGRRQFTRWALTYNGITACPRWPGCSNGFEAISPHLDWFTQKIQVGSALVQAIPLISLLGVVQELISEDQYALLCDREDCERCNAVRAESKT
jgi:aminoglycoside 3-N-acetyltransferase